MLKDGWAKELKRQREVRHACCSIERMCFPGAAAFDMDTESQQSYRVYHSTLDASPVPCFAHKCKGSQLLQQRQSI